MHNTMITLHRKKGGLDQWAESCKSEDGRRGVMSTTIRHVPNGEALVLFPKVKDEIGVGALLSLLPEPQYTGLTEDESLFFGLTSNQECYEV